MKGLRIGTCSWKYDSWRGLVYPEKGKINHLEEYGKSYSTVEIDQWFWSLFGPDRVRLPDRNTVREYSDSVPDDFRFTIKVPNSITLTHFYTRGREARLQVNPHFLSPSLMNSFLESIQGAGRKIGALIFQFEYLNLQKMPSQRQFQEQFSHFLSKCPREYPYALETRNPKYLNRGYFDFLAGNGLAMVFMQGYYMPSIFDTYREFGQHIIEPAVIRLMGTGREQIESRAKKKWDNIVEPKDRDIEHLSVMLRDLLEKKIEVYVNVNNHYEGSAPRTIEKIRRQLDQF